jgi:hypothetical protein
MMDFENHLGSDLSSSAETEKKGYNEGYVLCSECRNLESYWKNGEFVFFMCKTHSVTMKKLEGDWRKCAHFVHTNESPFERKNEIP